MDNVDNRYERYLDGDEGAFEELVCDYRRPLIAFIHRYVHNLFCAEDLAEDVFVALILHKKRYRRGATFRSYLFTIARNMALNHCKKNRRQSLLALDDLPELPTEKLTEELLLTQEEMASLHRAMDALKEEYRVALYLVYFEAMSAEEVGGVMKKSRKQVENLIYRGRTALKEQLRKEEP